MVDVNIVLPRKNFDVVIKETFSPGITGIYGHSGSGKTSLLHAIAGLETPKKGHVGIAGKTVFDSEEKLSVPVQKRRVGYVFQEGRLFPHMSVAENLRYGMKPEGDLIPFEEVVDLLKLTELLNSRASVISGGERQRVALGRALLSSPDILLLDEPFSAVDVRLRRQILPFLETIQKRIQIPMLVVSHDLPDLLRLTHSLCIIEEGRCLGHGEYYALLQDESLAGILGETSVLNSLLARVTDIKPRDGLVFMRSDAGGESVLIKCDFAAKEFREGEELKLFIQGHDVALSHDRLEQVTIQNQLQGTVMRVVQSGSRLLCMVDVGFSLAVQISVESRRRMDIHPGKEIWCLFKSSAVSLGNGFS